MNAHETPKCGTCGQWLLEKHDWNGAIWWEHEKPCVPIPMWVDESDGDEELLTEERICAECLKKFRPNKKDGGQKVCGNQCRQTRRERLFREAAERRDLKIKPRRCEQCQQWFTPPSIRARKQLLCSRKCQWTRQNEKRRAA